MSGKTYKYVTSEVERHITQSIHRHLTKWLDIRYNPRSILYLGSKPRIQSYDEVHNTIWLLSGDGRVYEVTVNEVVLRSTGPDK